MRRFLRARYLTAAFIALVMVIYGAVTSVRNTQENLSDFAEVQHTRIVLADLEGLLVGMLNLETGYQGYLLTGKDEFLAPYEEARKRVGPEIDRLEELTKGNHDQGLRLAQIRETVLAKMRESDRAIAIRRSGDAQAAAALVSTEEGKRTMDHLRLLIAKMRDEEQQQLRKSQMELVSSFKETNTIVVTTSVVAIAAGIIGTILLALYLMAKERQERLFFEKEKAVQADRAKTDFLAMMSHEIRTPMNAILGFSELLHELSDKPQQKHYAKAIMTSGNSLLSLINDILDLSKIEAEKMDLHPEVVEMKRFAENLETLFSFRAQEKSLLYRVTIDPSVPASLTFDALRLRQVLVNLVGNALKFTREGHVHVGIRAESSAKSDAVLLHFEVEDSGIGISGDQLPHIFRPFYQVESEQGRHFQGTGLGLGISERLITLMGGKIEVQSEIGKGSIFRVAVPVRRQPVSRAEMTVIPGGGNADFNRLAPSKILVVDDVSLNRELIRGYLQGSHHQLLEAKNGEQAVILCRRQLPDIVLMDIRMPIVDGRSAHAMLKAQEATRKIPLIAVTASSLLNSQDELQRMFDGFASKPISRERLFLELSKFLPIQATAATGKPRPEEPVAETAHSREWPELHAELAVLRDSVLPGLIELVPAQATLRFAGDLSEKAEKHDCLPLADYAGQLDNAAANMDFAEAGRLLAMFPGLIDRLRHDPV
ncbi:CHASE3 domain-containing protein [Luteolibacter sp. Populi]|uniref:CHASE3 domain-containing protein n=1 Tax=Luteolibacter sp. Populi TaxID=3230487 RepID=UPI003465137E